MTEENELEDLLPEQETIPWIPKEFLCMNGEFKIGEKESIPYFLTIATIRELEKYFHRMDEFEGAGDWGLQALFQRDINMERVREALVDGYLEREGKTNFFPPLTVALVPYDADERKLSETIPKPTGSVFEGTQTFDDLIEIRYGAGGKAAYIKWSHEKVRAIVIDGQHRMAALTLYGQKHREERDIVSAPVNIVLLHEGASALTQTRELFIDINNNARAVSDTRLIVLDDRDPFRSFTRELLADTNMKAMATLSEDVPKLPFWVVDWRADDPNPVGPHQITTLNLLHRCVRNFFGNASSQDLERELKLSSALEEHGVEGFDVDNRAPQLVEEQMALACEAFNERVAPFFLRIYKEVSIFGNFIGMVCDIAKDDSARGNAFREYLISPKDHRDELLRKLRINGIATEKVIIEPLELLKKTKDESDNLLLLAIGQRAIFSDIRTRRRIYEDSNSHSLASRFAADLNALIEVGFFDKRHKVDGSMIWEGQCLRLGRVAVTEAGIARISAMISLAIHAIRFEGDPELFHESLDIGSLQGAVSKVRDAYARIFLNDEDLDLDEEESKERAMDFIREILDSLRGAEL